MRYLKGIILSDLGRLDDERLANLFIFLLPGRSIVEILYCEL